jgi:hypothetical protein
MARFTYKLQESRMTLKEPIQTWLIHLPTAIAKNGKISHQSRGDTSRYGRIHLPSAIVMNGSISYQSRRGLSRYGWIHLQTAIVKNDNISHQPRRDHSDMVGFTYSLQ